MDHPVAISRERHFRSPKRKTETTFIDLITPQNEGKLTSVTFGHSKVGHRYVQNARFLKNGPRWGVRANGEMA